MNKPEMIQEIKHINNILDKTPRKGQTEREVIIYLCEALEKLTNVVEELVYVYPYRDAKP